MIGCLLFYSNVWPLNRTKGIFQGFDLREYTYPYFDFIAEEVHQYHELPLWNPHQLSGFSIIGAGEVNLFYPPNWLIFILEPRKAVALNVILHGFIGMWGVAEMARRVGASRMGALLAGLLWGGSGLIGARISAGHYTILLPLAWMPWVLTAYLGAIRQGSWKAGLRAAMAMGVLLLAGHPQIALITSVSVLTVWGFEVFRQSSKCRFLNATRPLITMGAVSVLLAAIALLPVVETALVSERNAADRDGFEFADRYSLPANQLLTFVFPYMIGAHGIPGDANFVELFAYIGLLPLLALVVLLARPSDNLWLLLILSGLGLILSLAMDGGLLRLLIQVFPFLSMFRSAGRWLILPQIALACVAALFMTHLQTISYAERKHSLRKLVRVIPRISIGLFGFAFVMSWSRVINSDLVDAERLWISAQIVAKTALFLLFFELALLALRFSEIHLEQTLVLLIFISILDVWSVSLPLLKVGNTDTYNPFWSELKAVISPLTVGNERLMISQARYKTYTGATGLGYYDVTGYEQLSADSYSEWVNDTNLLALSNRLMGIGYVVRAEAYPDDLLDPEHGILNLVSAQPEIRLYVYKFRRPVPRAFLATGVVVEPNDEAVRGYYATNTHVDTSIVRVGKSSSCLRENIKGGQAEIVEYRPNRVRVKVDSEGPGVLFLSDRYAPGWRVTVDGISSEIYKANTEFRAICVPAGESDVLFSYQPLSLYLGGSISALAWLGTGIMFLVSYTRNIHSDC
jgi:hypothetical protein